MIKMSMVPSIFPLLFSCNQLLFSVNLGEIGKQGKLLIKATELDKKIKKQKTENLRLDLL